MQNTAEKMEASFPDDGGAEAQGSLLTFADMALALDIFTADHTYALHDEEKQPTVLERILRKEKDHNYSFTSKRGRSFEQVEDQTPAPSDHGYSSLAQSQKRSLSEENLSKRRLLSSNPVYISNANVQNKNLSQDSLAGSSENLPFCNSWPKPNFFEGIGSRDHTYARDEFNIKSTKSDHGYSLSTNKSEESICNGNINQLPHPNSSNCALSERKESVKFDHAYFDKPASVNQNLHESENSVRFDHAYFDKPTSANHALPENKVSVNFDHAYFDKPAGINHNALPEVQKEVTVKSEYSYCDQIPVNMLELCYLNDKNVSSYSTKLESMSNEKQLPLFGRLRNKMTIASDHAYEGIMVPHDQRKDLPRTIAPASTASTCTKSDTDISLSKTLKDSLCKPRTDHNYYNGSVESLDMNLSSSDTDSCDETAAEVTRLAFSAWCQLRKDHPYSTI